MFPNNYKKESVEQLKAIYLFFSVLLCLPFFSQTIGVTSPATTGTYCAGTTVSVNFTISGVFTGTNVFTAQLSDASGSFISSPTTIGTRTATTAAAITCTIPYSTPAGTLYRIRVISSNPPVNGSDNGANLTITAMTIGAPVVPSSSYCGGAITSITYTQACNYDASNVYSVQLSDAAGSFASPTTIGTRTAASAAAITCTIPLATPFGTGYRIRIVTSNPVLTSNNNGSNITINTNFGNPAVFGVNTWNAYAFDAFNNYTLNYQGFYTDNNLSFNSQTRFVNTSSPSTATVGAGSTGLAFAGCSFGNGTNYSMSYKRTNIPCGLYQIDMPAHDDNAYFFINNVLVWSHIGCCDAHINIFTGFISPTDNLEFRYTNGGGPGYLAVNIIALKPLVMQTPITICAGSNATISALNTNTLSVNYSWAPAASAAPSVGSLTTVINPTVTTIYTLSATDTGTSGCAHTNTIAVTVNPLPTPTASTSATYVCSGTTNATLTAGGAASYTWSPAAGLNTTIGYSVIASPSVNTTYTVSASNNCATLTATVLITANLQPATPSPTTYGNGVWNVFCYFTPNTYSYTTSMSEYYGYYTENNLSFNSSNRWGTGSTPSAATGGTAGLAYQGCVIGVDYHSTISKRTNFTCGYYQINIPYHDDDITVYVNGAQVFQHIGCCDVHTNIWSGFLGPSSTVDFWHREGGGGSGISATFSLIPYPILSPNVTICSGTSATLTASPFISGANYVWSAPTPSDLSTTIGTVTIASPTVSGSFTCNVIDPVTTCSASASTSINVNPLPTTTVAPTSVTTTCGSQQYTLTAGGANTYSWSPSTGLNTTSGSSVIASPTVTTVYTVSGNNNCAAVAATTTITVIPLITPSVFPNTIWNVYGYNDQSFSSYFGYYTENGTGPSGYNFNTATRWASGAAPSTANSTNGGAWIGCNMSASNISLSFKRTGFICNTYSINVLGHDDSFYLFINGTQVAAHIGCCDAHPVIWSGPLSTSTTVEFRLTQGTGGSGLNVSFTPASVTPSLSTWIGAISGDWFSSSNWCGSGVPTATTDVLIPYLGTTFQPTIASSGAACRSLTLTAAIASTSLSPAVPAASLTVGGAFGLDVYGSWYNNGNFNAGTGTVSLLGSSTRTISTNSTETFNNLIVNTTGAINFLSGTHNIANNMNFTSGIITQNGILQFLNGATATNASNLSYVNGSIVKFGTQAFSFPVGAGSLYRPISISAPSVVTDNFTAQYFNNDPSPSFTHTAKDPTIDHIGRCEYWILNRTGGISNVSVTLTWNSNSCGVTNLGDLLVARWDAGQVLWKDHGNGGTTGNTTSGSVVSSAPVTLFSPFTLASSTSANPLPIELVSFNCNLIHYNNIELSWVTASETNSDYFAIERSTDGINFEMIAKKKSAGNSSTTLYYSYNDINAERDIVYYRLKHVDVDGKYKYSPICSATNSKDKSEILFYPNPVKNSLTVDFSRAENNPSTIFIVSDITGKIIYVPVQNSKTTAILDCSLLEEGVYFLKVIRGNKEVVNKFTVQK